MGKIIYINSLKFIIFLSLLTCHALAGTSIKTEAENLLSKSEKFRSLGNSYTMKVKITDVSSENRQQSEFLVTIKDNTTSMVEQLAPEKARGRKMLMIKNDLWLYTPDIKKPIRISLAQKLTGETANGDITKTDFLHDYRPLILARDKNIIKLKLESINTSATYDKIYYYINASNNRPIKAEFMAKSGKQLKTAYYNNFIKFKNKILLTEIKIVDAIKINKHSILKYDKFEIKKMDDSLFNKDSF